MVVAAAAHLLVGDLQPWAAAVVAGAAVLIGVTEVVAGCKILVGARIQAGLTVVGSLEEEVTNCFWALVVNCC